MKHLSLHGYPDFTSLHRALSIAMVQSSDVVSQANWQGINVSDKPGSKTHELLNVSLSVPLRGNESLDHWRDDIKPNLPWADNHFKERVCGYPINPGIEWENWPWGDNAAKFRTSMDDQFNHNYMERYWPRYAGQEYSTKTVEEWRELYHYSGEYPNVEENIGLRHTFGTLDDLVELLVSDPLTRQAYMPIFFPEDTGIGDGGRKPCSLGYHFIVRDGEIGIYYPMRSCDLIRHWADDVYLTIRLLLWVLDKCRESNSFFDNIKPGKFLMHMTSLHVFENDYLGLKK